jgi:hypothetical protein
VAGNIADAFDDLRQQVEELKTILISDEEEVKEALDIGQARSTEKARELENRLKSAQRLSDSLATGEPEMLVD